jgi:plastocyanin
MKRTILFSLIPLLGSILIFSTGSFATRYSIDVKDFVFSPSNLPGVKIGDTIHFEWQNGSHTTTSTSIPAGALAWDKPIDATHLTYDYIPTVAGLYRYKCTPHESAGMVGQFTVQITGIGENDRIPKISIYPNPFSERINIKCDLQEGIFFQHLIIYDVSGKIIRESSFSERSSFPDYINLTGIPDGMLFFEFTDNMNRSCFLKAIRKE